MNRMMKFAIAGPCLLIFAILFGFVAFPKLLKGGIHKMVNLKPGTDVRALWSKIPFEIDFKIYLFNVTNPNEIKNGAKPIVNEVGPYFFEEWHEKNDLIDNDDDDTVIYSPKNTFYFNPGKSNGLTGEEELMLPHIFILAMVFATMREKPSAAPLINKAINSIFKNPENVFIKAKAMDLMFRGLPIDCSVTDTAGSAVCSLLKANTDDLIVDDPDHFRFALLGAKNGTTSKNRIKVLRGVKKLTDIGVVTELNGKKKMTVWNDSKCDAYQGTDGYVFHPYLYADEDIVSFAPDLCRSIAAYTESTFKKKGLLVNRYTAWLGDPAQHPEQKCYCPTPGCLKAGMMDLHKCVGVPLVASHPHFFRGDKEYLQMVDGLSPNKENHMIYIDFEPFSGTPLEARKRLQFNIMIHKVEKVKMMKNFPEAMLPLFWVEEGLVIPNDFVKQVKMLHMVVKVMKVLTWIKILAGLGMIGYAGFLYYKSTLSKTSEVTKPPKYRNGNSQMSTVDTKNLHSQMLPPID
ncbi:sensory neuron membrane protein 1-like [Phymastichus coffea]|uniref:sensory neuron membrane protein 1-like n=1 Tax=Phymastichus coffea TaxID=108790 RepID=UPI00273CB2CE|nr:sensory neuron membrane protein 1-like [Phymastichus coffea]